MIAEAFERNGKRAALMPYLMGGYPDLETSAEAGEAAIDAGADLLELGGVRAAPNLFVVDADVAHEGKKGLPCNGDIFVVRTPDDTRPLPAPLRAHRELTRKKAVAVAGAAFDVIELER